MFKNYFRALYRRTMDKAYAAAYEYISKSVGPDSMLLDCGANTGKAFDRITRQCPLLPSQYHGIEWNALCVEKGQDRDLHIERGDLNKGISQGDETYTCVYALSVLEHLLTQQSII